VRQTNDALIDWVAQRLERYGTRCSWHPCVNESFNILFLWNRYRSFMCVTHGRRVNGRITQILSTIQGYYTCGYGIPFH